jgi:beta-glucosidase
MKPNHSPPVQARQMMLNSILAVALALLLALAWWWFKAPAAVPVTAAQPLPAGFIWGVSSSAFQSEGGAVDSDWSRVNAADATQDRYGLSVDFRHRYRQDVALARELGVNTYRIGISWARVEPQPGQFDEAELRYYDDLMAALKQAGIAPLITLDHFDSPAWVAEQGGWTSEKTVADFVAYAKVIATRYHDDVHLWITINEAMAAMGGQMVNHHVSLKKFGQVKANVVAAHRQVYDLIHQLDADAMVTSNIVWMGDRRGGALFGWIIDPQFLDQIKDKCDVIAFDYYGSDSMNLLKGVTGKANWLWQPDPPGLYRALKKLQAQNPDKPILIAEIGMATQDGQPRADGLTREDVLRDTVYWTQRARADGVNVIGYMVWSLTDNFEWGSYTPRFGLYTVNVLKDPQLTRIPTAAVPAYQQIIRQQGVAADYRPLAQ